MPPQGKPAASDYGNPDIVKILASPEFQSSPPELQRQVRERLGLTQPAATPSATPVPKDSTAGTRFEGIAKVGNFILGRGEKYKNSTTLLQDLERVARDTAARREREDSSDPSRTMAGRAFRQYSPRTIADLAEFLHGAGSNKNAALGAASMVPYARPFIGAYGLLTSGKELAKSRQPGETDADYLQRTLFALSGVAGSVALGKSGRLRTPKAEMESRINRATFASGSQPGTPNAFRMTIPDIMETVSSRKLPLKSVSDLARAVEATNERFNAQMALAEQPYAGDMVLPRKAADALRAAADDLPKSAQNEAAQLRSAAKQFDRPMTLRELGREVRQQNRLFGTHGGKTSLELSTAKTRASVAINDILRKSLRDVYVDYLESKHPGAGLRDMRLRQEQVLNLRETLGEYNKSTGRVEKGHAEKLEAEQAKFRGGPAGPDVHGVASQHGIRGYLRLPKSLRRGPETVANRAVGKAFHEDIGHRIPRRKLGPLSPKRPSGETPIDELTRRGPGAAPAKAAASEATAETQRQAEATARKASLDRQLAASKKHPEWAARIRAKVAAAESEAEQNAGLKKAATPAADTNHLQTAVSELFPEKKFGDLTSKEQSVAIARSLELKFGKTRKPSTKAGD